MRYLILACILSSTAALALADDAGSNANDLPRAVAKIINSQGKHLGNVSITQVPAGGVLVHGKLKGLPPGVRAIHVHKVGTCTPPSFESAGDHAAPEGNEHGYLNAQGPHAGDFPNLHIPASGKITFEYYNALLSLTGGDATGVLDDDGAAVIIHSGTDDYRSQPSGASGGRIACGVIRMRSD